MTGERENDMKGFIRRAGLCALLAALLALALGPSALAETQVPCAVCYGTGYQACVFCGGTGSSFCMTCAGRGYRTVTKYVYDPLLGGTMPQITQETCMMCYGKGKQSCMYCGGQGKTLCTICGGTGYLSFDDSAPKATATASPTATAAPAVKATPTLQPTAEPATESPFDTISGFIADITGVAGIPLGEIQLPGYPSGQGMLFLNPDLTPIMSLSALQMTLAFKLSTAGFSSAKETIADMDAIVFRNQDSALIVTDAYARNAFFVLLIDPMD